MKRMNGTLVSSRVAMTVVGSLAALGVLSVAKTSAAADPVPCSTLTENPIVIESGDTQEPLLKSLGRALRGATPPMTVMYRTTGTCAVAGDLYKPNKIAAPATLKYMTKDSDVPLECSVDAAGGLTIDLGIGATFISSCPNLQQPDRIGLITGPIQGYGFAVPKGSSQVAMTAEEGYFAFGNFGAQGNALPWIDREQRFIRGQTKSTALTLAAAIGISPANKLTGWDLAADPKRDTSDGVLNALIGSTAQEKAIGLLGTEIFDANRDKVKLLAFRAAKQLYAYYPDSTPSSFDKRNLRDGHYFPWAPTIYIAPVASGGDPAKPVPSNPLTKRFVDLVLGKAPSTDVDGLAVVIGKGLVPNCAMKVTRTADGAPLTSSVPDEPCGCYFESKVPNGSTSCQACNGSDATCNGGKCRHGYCEAR